MGMLPASSFQDYFATLTDPRCPDAPNRRHPLMDILLIAVCAVICGAEGWEDLEGGRHGPRQVVRGQLRLAAWPSRA
jgi:DDE_Tnp_1-associated